MKLRLFYFILLFVPSLICSMDKKRLPLIIINRHQSNVWSQRIEQAMQDRLKYDLLAYSKKSSGYKKDQEFLKNT